MKKIGLASDHAGYPLKEQVKEWLKDMGYEFVDTSDDADLVIFNTCAVREHAEDRVFGNVGALVHLKKKKAENPQRKQNTEDNKKQSATALCFCHWIILIYLVVGLSPEVIFLRIMDITLHTINTDTQ